MIDLLRDPFWQFIGATLALAAILVTMLVYLAQRQRKNLSYVVVSNIALLSVAEQIRGQVEIVFKGRPFSQVFLIVLRLTNTGNSPIVAADFERALHVSFGDKATILTAEVSETDPSNPEAKVSVKDEMVVLEPTLMNSGDSITIKTLLSQFGKIGLDARIVGVKRIEQREDELIRFRRINSLAQKGNAVGIALMVGALVLSSYGFDRTQLTAPIVIGAVIGITSATVSVVFSVREFLGVIKGIRKH